MTVCSRCHRPLKDPASIERGMGPVCWKLAWAEAVAAEDSTELPFEGNVVLKRLPDGRVATNVERLVIRHSPSGFEWGYGGSGPADLALNILLMFTDADTADRLYQDFKWQFVAKLPPEGGVIKGDDIRAWIRAHEKGLVA
jgi:hypothetical protein